MDAARRALIITADDFGLHPSVNQAVESAHRDGVLRCASLMVGAPAAADAIERATRLPQLRVGLHLVLADGQSILPYAAIPDLVDESRRFDDNMARAGVRFFFKPGVRAQLKAEIRAQFERFAASGLALDHVNTHKHFHLHPTVLGLILSIGREFGLRAMRLPRAVHAQLLLRPWLALLRARLDAAGIAHNDFVIGLRETGHCDEATILAALANLPRGTGELYLHPATESGSVVSPSMASYEHSAELASLLSPRLRDALTALRIDLISFSDLGAPA